MDPNTHLLPPPPPPAATSIFQFASHHSSGGTFPVIAIAIIGIVATGFLLVSYYVFVIKCCLNYHRIDFLRRFSFSRRHPRENPSSVVYSPALVLSRGLEESLIRSIPIIRFRREARKPDAPEDATSCYYECAVCLSEFKEGEKLRVIPNCCHAFHIDCIDVWLQNSANCPLCRSSISADSLLAIDQTVAPSSSPQDPSPDCFSGNDADYVVIELQNNNPQESPSFSIGSSPLKPEQQRINSVSPKQKGKKDKTISSMGDECIDMRETDKEFKIMPIRRSISMDSSSDRQLYLQIQEILQQQSRQVNPSEGCSSRSIRRSFFSLSNVRG